MVPLAHATSEGSDEPAHPHSLADKKKMVEKASRLPSVYIQICNFAFLPNSTRNFFVCKQQRRRSASTPAQFYQLSLESMRAKPAT